MYCMSVLDEVVWISLVGQIRVLLPCPGRIIDGSPELPYALSTCQAQL